MNKGLGLLILTVFLSITVYTPISLFSNTLPPFNTTQKLYVYSYIPKDLEGLKIKSIQDYPTISSYSIIQDAKERSLILIRETYDYTGNPWFLGTLPIFVIGFIGSVIGLIFLLGVDNE